MTSVLFIDHSQQPSPSKEHVAWIDIMGTKNIFQKDDKCPTIYILKLHTFAQRAMKSNPSIKIYPIIDGLFVTGLDKTSFINSLQQIFEQVAQEFISETDPQYRFIIRAGVAYGSVIHGESITSAPTEITDEIKKSLLFGKAVINAAIAEGKGLCPFSITIDDESLSAFSGEPLNNKNQLLWFHKNNFGHINLQDKILEYYMWLQKNPHWTKYAEDQNKLQKHLYESLVMLNNDRPPTRLV